MQEGAMDSLMSLTISKNTPGFKNLSFMYFDHIMLIYFKLVS